MNITMGHLSSTTHCNITFCVDEVWGVVHQNIVYMSDYIDRVKNQAKLEICFAIQDYMLIKVIYK